MRNLLTAATLIAALPLLAAAQPEIKSIRVRAFIDGQDSLIVSAGTVQWHHTTFAAVGRWFDPDTETQHNEPTYLTVTTDQGSASLTWTPVWPSSQAPELRDQDVFSTPFPLPGTLPFGVATPTLNIINARNPLGITTTQSPSPADNYTTIVGFDDIALNGADWYEVEIFFRKAKVLDRVPQLMSGPSISTDLAHLVSGGTSVLGIAADGVSQVVIRARGTSDGDIVKVGLTLCGILPSDTTCQPVPASTAEYGGLFDPARRPALRSQLRRPKKYRPTHGKATPDGQRRLAIAAYSAPAEFVRQSVQGDTLFGHPSRDIYLRIEVQQSNSQSAVVFQKLSIVRPP